MSLESSVPADPLACHPTTAYFWGHVAGSGSVTENGLEVTTNDETSASVLAAIAGADGVDHETTSREYAHNTAITRTEDEYTVTVEVDDDGLFGRTAGLPVGKNGQYRLTAFRNCDRELLRGLLEGCGTICFKSKSGTVGISFVHDDRALLGVVRERIADAPVDAPMGDLAVTSSGGYWFGIDDAAAPEFGTWLYENCEETGCFAPSRRRKLEASLEQATAYQ